MTLALDGRRLGWPLVLGAAAALCVCAQSVAGAAALAALLLIAPLTWHVFSEPHRWLGLFFASALVAPPLPINLGSSGPHISLLFLAAGLVVGLLCLDHWRMQWDSLTVRLFVFGAVLFGSTGLAFLYSGWSVGFGSVARAGLFLGACFVFLWSAYGPPKDFTRLLYMLVAASAVIACLDFQFQWPAPAGYGPQFVWLDSGIFRRAQGVFYEASTLGNLCACFLTFAVLCLLRDDAPVPRWILLLGAAPLAMALILSFSRASLVNLGISVAVLLWLHRSRIPVHWWILAPILIFAGGAITTMALFPEFAQMYWLRVNLSAQYLFSATDSVLSGRIVTWQRIAVLLSENPWQLFFGIGYKSLPYSDVAGAPIIADNMYLSLLAETGVVGLVCFLWWNAAILRTCWRARGSLHGAWMFSFWCGQLIQMMSGDLLTYWRVMPVYLWVMGQALRASRP